MKYALISPAETVSFISNWKVVDKKIFPVITVIATAQRIAEVANQKFDIAEPLYWVECRDDVVADQWYYDSQAKACTQIPEPPPVPAIEPTVTTTEAISAQENK